MKKCVCGEEMTPAEWKNQWVCHRCGRTKPMSTTVTNADRIRSMSDTDLAWELMLWRCEAVARNHGVSSEYPDTQQTILKWLQQPAEEDNHA